MVTALTIMVNFVAFVMEPKQAGMTILIYLLIGIAGVPVFVGGTSGIAKIIGPTGGFNVGFLVAAMAMSACRGHSHHFRKLVMLGICVGMPVIYIGGCISMYAVNRVGVMATLWTAVIPFLFGDVVKVVIAAMMASKLSRYGIGD
jgi:biotin transport system substrate-specific component